jgi:hypothetical protein
VKHGTFLDESFRDGTIRDGTIRDLGRFVTWVVS